MEDAHIVNGPISLSPFMLSNCCDPGDSSGCAPDFCVSIIFPKALYLPPMMCLIWESQSSSCVSLDGHWEFLPAFAAELVPGVDLVPFWMFAVSNVYRKWKQVTPNVEELRQQRPTLKP